MKTLMLATAMAALTCWATTSWAQQPAISNTMSTRLFVERCGAGELTGRCREVLASTVYNAAHYPGACAASLPSDAAILDMVWNYMKRRAGVPTSYDTVSLSVMDALASSYGCSTDDY